MKCNKNCNDNGFCVKEGKCMCSKFGQEGEICQKS